jgi:hypothetical protein
VPSRLKTLQFPFHGWEREELKRRVGQTLNGLNVILNAVMLHALCQGVVRFELFPVRSEAKGWTDGRLHLGFLVYCSKDLAVRTHANEPRRLAVWESHREGDAKVPEKRLRLVMGKVEREEFVGCFDSLQRLGRGTLQDYAVYLIGSWICTYINVSKIL